MSGSVDLLYSLQWRVTVYIKIQIYQFCHFDGRVTPHSLLSLRHGSNTNMDFIKLLISLNGVANLISNDQKSFLFVFLKNSV